MGKGRSDVYHGKSRDADRGRRRKERVDDRKFPLQRKGTFEKNRSENDENRIAFDKEKHRVRRLLLDDRLRCRNVLVTGKQHHAPIY